MEQKCSFNDKPYRSLDYEMKQRFGEKVYRLVLSSGLTCPNRDGKIGYGGCIFCSAGGSGEFAGVFTGASVSASAPGPGFPETPGLSPAESVRRQIASQKAMIKGKRPVHSFIAYFQAFTSTYGPVSYLEEIFTAAISDPEVAVLSVATRPDELPEEVISLLSALNRIKPVWVELGLQTVHEDSAAFIRRGYRLPCFEEAVRGLRREGIEVIVHTILYLPGEDESRMMQTIDYLSELDIQGIKLSLLHVLKGTDLARLYGIREPVKESGMEQETCFVLQASGPGAEMSSVPDLVIPSMEEYIGLVIRILERLPQRIVIHRLTGDGPSALLLAPLWTQNKRTVLNTLHRRMKELDAWQGKAFSGTPGHS